MLDAEPKRWNLSALRSMVVADRRRRRTMIDGFERRHGCTCPRLGMTETNPLGTLARVKRRLAGADAETVLGIRSTQGYAVPFVETRHVGDDGRVLPRDGETMGELEVRGPWVAAGYLGGGSEEKWTADGWFKTADVVTIDKDGYVRITDRTKDVIKSGGEWIVGGAGERAHGAPRGTRGRRCSPGSTQVASGPSRRGVQAQRKATEPSCARCLEARFVKEYGCPTVRVRGRIPRT